MSRHEMRLLLDVMCYYYGMTVCADTKCGNKQIPGNQIFVQIED